MSGLSLDPTYLGYRAASAVARALPASAVAPSARLMGRAAARKMAGRRLIVERNLRRAIGDDLSELELARLVDDAFASYAHYYLESFRLPGTAASVIAEGTVDVGFEHLQAGIDAGNGVIIATPHLGAWEWMAFWITAVKHLPVTAVAEAIEPPELAAWFVGLRNALGMQVVPFGPDAAPACLKALKANHVLALPSDRDLSGNGIPVTFFGEETTLPGGPATLALRTGAPIVVLGSYYDNGRHLGVGLTPLDTERRGKLRDDIARVTQDMAHAFEDVIRRAPEQWHLMQPNWPSDHQALADAGLT